MSGKPDQPRAAPSSSSSSPASNAASNASAPAAVPAGEVEYPVGSVAELREGQMKEVAAGEGKVLLVREGGQVYATANKCTHMGAPLEKAALCGGRVRCQYVPSPRPSSPAPSAVCLSLRSAPDP